MRQRRSARHTIWHPGGAHGAGGDRAADALTHDDTTVAALARHLGVDWHTAWNAIEVEAKTRVGQTERLARVKTLGVDEHICGRPKWERIER